MWEDQLEGVSWLLCLEKCESTFKASMKKKMTLKLLEKVLGDVASTIKLAKAEKKELKHLEKIAPSVVTKSKGSMPWERLAWKSRGRHWASQGPFQAWESLKQKPGTAAFPSRNF